MFLELPPTVGLESFWGNRLISLFSKLTSESKVTLEQLTVPLVKAVQVALAVVTSRVDSVHGSSTSSEEL